MWNGFSSFGTRHRTEADGRATYVTLTQRGLNFLAQDERVCADITATLDLSELEFARLEQLLSTLGTNLAERDD